LPTEFNTSVATLTAAEQAQVAQQAKVSLIVPRDKIVMEEVGAKGLFLDNRLLVLAALYNGQWTNRHIPQSVIFTDTAGAQQGIIVNSAGGIVDLHGIELESTFKATEHLTLDATMAWNATDIRKTYSTDALALTGNASPVGTQLPLYAAETATFTVTYRTHVFSDFDGFARGDYFYTGKIYDTEANDAWTPPSNKVNIGIGIVNAKYRVELYGKNITNDLAPTSLQRNQFSTYNAAGDQTGSPNGIAFALADRPFWGLRASVKF
jgi:iron complex outermembrane receptor protein